MKLRWGIIMCWIDLQYRATHRCSWKPTVRCGRCRIRKRAWQIIISIFPQKERMGSDCFAILGPFIAEPRQIFDQGELALLTLAYFPMMMAGFTYFGGLWGYFGHFREHDK